MSLVIPLHAVLQFNAPRAQDVPVLLMEITDSSLASPIMLCSQPIVRLSDVPLEYGIVALGGNTYKFAFTGSMPSDQDGQTANVQLTLENITQELSANFLALSAQNTIHLTLVLASDPDTPIRDFPYLSITQVSLAASNLQLTIDRVRKFLGDQVSTEPWPSGRQTINVAPGLHKQ